MNAPNGSAGTNNLRAIMFMIIASMFFPAMHVTVQYLGDTSVWGEDTLHTTEVVFFRNLLALLVLVPLFSRIGISQLKTKQAHLYAIRSIFHVMAMLCWFGGLPLLGLAEATALNLIIPFFVATGAILVFKEQSKLIRWMAIVLGCFGAALIIQDRFGEGFDFERILSGEDNARLGVLLILLSAVLFTIIRLFAKHLTRQDSSPTVVAYMAIMITPLSLVPALFFWQWPTWEQFFYLCLIGIFGTFAHLFNTHAFKIGDLTVVEPFTYFRLLSAAALGYLVFANIPSSWTWVGSAVLVSGGVLLGLSETRGRRAKSIEEPTESG